MKIVLIATLIALLQVSCEKRDGRMAGNKNCKKTQLTEDDGSTTEKCESATKPVSKDPGPAPEPSNTPTGPVSKEDINTPPVEVKDKITTDRRYFQSRSVISLKPTSDVLGVNDEFSLINATSKKTLIARQTMAMGLAENSAWNLADTQDEFILQLYPVLGVEEDQFKYGSNNLRFWINGNGEQKYSLIEIFLQDFDIMGLTTATTKAEDDTSSGFEGWVNVVANPVVSDDGSLTTGVYNIVND